MEPDIKFPEPWKFCIVCIACASCDRPQCQSVYARDRPLDLSVKSNDFKVPSVLKRPTSLPIMGRRTLSILDRDMSGLSKRAPHSKPELPLGFGNPYPYGRVLATGQMRRERQKIAERLVIFITYCFISFNVIFCSVISFILGCPRRSSYLSQWVKVSCHLDMDH